MAQPIEFTATWQDVLWDTAKLAIAYVLALPIGWNREREGHSAGLRTFPIVSIAACGFAMVGLAIPNAQADSHSRILQGLITGIGFVGGGAILRDQDTVRGTATAASIWLIGSVGASVGLGMYHIAIVLAVINFLTFEVLTPFKHRLDSESRSRNGQGSD